MRSVRLGLFLLLSLSACGESKVPSAPGTRKDSGPSDSDGGYSNNGGRGGASGGKGGSSGSSGSSGTGGTGMSDAGVDPLAPSLSFLTPTPTTDANSQDVITVTSLNVRCKVEASTEVGAGKVDKSAVKIAIQNPTDASIFVDGAVSAISDTEFEATFEVSSRANGMISFQCRAKDLMNHASTKVMTTLIDMGPKITVKKPQDKQRYALKTPMPIEFQVAADPVGDGDEGAQVKNVVLNVGGAEFKELVESKDTPGLYQASIDFSNKVKFPVTPESAQLQISATNSRSPSAATRIVRLAVTIDGTGPGIVILSPPNVSIQRGVVPLSVMVTDPAGIMPGTLIATINTQRYNNWEGTAPNFALSFDTNQLDPMHELTQLTINITAIDSVGNKTDPPVSLLLRLDNLPPVISLDPPIIVESRLGSDQMTHCSQPFDPVGSLAASDKQHVSSTQIFRALVEDRTNHTGNSFRWYSDVNPAAVELYIQALDYPLLVDTNSDGICDAINKSDDMNIRDTQRVSPDNDPQKIKLDPITTTGNSWFAKSTIAPYETPGCSNDPGGAENPPSRTCPSSEMTRIVAGRNQSKPPAVYAIVPSNDANSGVCNGDQWNIKSVARGTEGWICFAARAADGIGNIGISEPIRLCFDDGVGTPPDCSGEPPSCRGKDDMGIECTISDAQKFTPDIWPVPP